jgi:hypothetical protein
MQPAKLNYKVFQGSTFEEIYRWESETKVYVPIQSISKAAPCVITTSIAHNLPVGWRFRVVGAGGMKEINSVGEDGYHLSTGLTVVPPTLIDTDALEDYYLTRLEIWENVRDQDAVLVAPVLRPWRLMTTQDAYNFIMQQSPQYLPAIPSSFPPILNSANNAYTAWQQAIASNQAAVAAAQAAQANKIEINQTNSLGYTTYTSGGVVEYNQPVPLNNLSARMQIRETVDSPTVIYSTTSAVGGNLFLDNVLKTIRIRIPAEITQTFDFSTAVYSIELFESVGKVVPFVGGNLTLVPEVTR